MVATMVIRTPLLTGYATVRHVDVSLPLVACLLDGEKYMNPRDVRPLEGQECGERARHPCASSSSWRCGATAPSNSTSGCGAATSGKPYGCGARPSQLAANSFVSSFQPGLD
jgi:hypothetical protein